MFVCTGFSVWYVLMALQQWCWILDADLPEGVIFFKTLYYILLYENNQLQQVIVVTITF